MSEKRKLPEISSTHLPEFNPKQPSPFVLRTVRWLARVDWKKQFLDMLDRALKAAEGVNSRSAKAELFGKIATALAQIDPQRAAQVFERALERTEGNLDEPLGFDRDLALRQITQDMLLVKLGGQRALAVAEWIQNKRDKVWVFHNIASELAKEDPRAAAQLFERALEVANEIQDKERKDEAYCEIAQKLAFLARTDSQRAVELLERALEVAEGIKRNDKDKAWVLRDIAEELAKIDIEQALAVADRIPYRYEDRDWAFHYIAEELANVNVEQALAVADRIGVRLLVSTLRKIAPALARVDPLQAPQVFKKALARANRIPDNYFVDEYSDEYWEVNGALYKVDALCTIATAMANVYAQGAVQVFEQALEIATSMEKDEDGYDEASVLCTIATALAKVDVQQALAVAERIQHKDYMAEALCQIATALTKMDTQRAAQVFEQAVEVIEGIENEPFRKQVVWKIVQGLASLAMMDPQQALEVTKRSQDNGVKSWALRAIAQELAKADLQRAAQVLPQAVDVAQGIQDEREKAEALREIASELVKVDVQRALAVAEQIPRGGHKASALCEIAKGLAKVDPQRALAVAEQMTTEYVGYGRASALREIAQELAKANPTRTLWVYEQAIRVAERIDERLERVWALHGIAAELAKVDVQRALVVAEGIQNKGYKARALCEAAQELAKVDVQRAAQVFEQAVAVAEGIQNEGDKGEALRGIAKELAKVGVHAAAKVAEGITDPYYQAYAFLGIAEVIWEKESGASQ